MKLFTGIADAGKSALRKVLSPSQRHRASEIAHLPQRFNRLERLLAQSIALELNAAFPSVKNPRKGPPRSVINAHERCLYSQNGEDGILAYLFARIGAEDFRFVEIGIGNGEECNTANLAISFGWKGLMMEANENSAFYAQQFFRRMSALPPKVVAGKVTPENINGLLKENGFTGSIDLLSLDIDGNDYWVLQAIDVVRPRVLVLEYNTSYGPTRSLSVKYDPDFDPKKYHPAGWYHGASLTALTKLAKSKGLGLIGCDSRGVNAFFLREDLLGGELKELAPEEAFYSLWGRDSKMVPEEQYKSISHLPHVEV
jgi:hypothetical protein